MRRVGWMAAAMAMTGIAVGVAVRSGWAQPEATTKPGPEAGLEAKLDELGRLASALVDGEECAQIVTDRAEELMFRVDPDDRWAGSDNYDVNPEPFLRTKKLLARIGKLADLPVDCNLWVKCKRRPEMVTIVIRQVHGWSQFYEWAQMAMEPTPEMKRALEGGERVLVRARPPRDHVSVLAPVRDSLGDVTGFVEVCTRRGALAAARR